MTSANILEPRDKSDVTLKFTAGLVLALPFTATVENVCDIRNIRIKVTSLVAMEMLIFCFLPSDSISGSANSTHSAQTERISSKGRLH